MKKSKEKEIRRDYEILMQNFNFSNSPFLNQKWEKRGDRFVTFSLFEKNETSIAGTNSSIEYLNK